MLTFNPNLGDVIYVNRGLYHHFGIYVGDGNVIHYAPKEAKKIEIGNGACVHQTTMQGFLKGGKKLSVLEFEDPGNAVAKSDRNAVLSLKRPLFSSNIQWATRLAAFAAFAGPVAPIVAPVAMEGVWRAVQTVFLRATEKRDQGYHLYTRAETVERARSRLDESKYNLVFRNCEHFAMWCRTGVSKSSQVDHYLRVLVGIPKKWSPG